MLSNTPNEENIIKTRNRPSAPYLNSFPLIKMDSNNGDIEIPANSQAEAMPKPVPIALGTTTKGTKV